ncbi:hypothetical protein QUF58_01745 [Anaerolineales bacterium HSG24]|nr:hypothetical protein [Anaerolineales bacterium HSG24]
MTDKKEVTQVEETKLPVYEIPTIVTFTDDEILEELGPAQANQYNIGDGVW